MADVIFVVSPVGGTAHALVSKERWSRSSSLVAATGTTSASFASGRHFVAASATATATKSATTLTTLSLCGSARHEAKLNHTVAGRRTTTKAIVNDDHCKLYGERELLGNEVLRCESDARWHHQIGGPARRRTTTTTTTKRVGLQVSASSADARDSSISASNSSSSSSSSPTLASSPSAGTNLSSSLVTCFFFFMWYLLNVIFNILNKKIYNYFPYPWFVSTIHLSVGAIYILVSWTTGLTKRAPISTDQIKALIPIAFCHALGHVMSNVSFNAVAVSFTHTVKALEPVLNAAASQFILGQAISLPVWFSLVPVVVGVAMASASEISFNWIGFCSAMTSNVAFTYRNIVSKKAMTKMDSTNLYAYVSMMSLVLLLPPTLIIEGPVLITGVNAAIAKIGASKLFFDLVCVGMFYHLYNQIASNTLERVAPLSHAVGNVLKRVFVIGFSILFFGNRITTITGVGTVIAIAGVAAYSFLKAKDAEAKLKRAVA